jgi:hypothetical protein
MVTMAARYRERRRAAITAGTWQPKADGAAVRAHLARLRAGGATYAEIAAAAGGLSHHTVSAVEAGDGDVMSATAAAILAVDPRRLDPVRSPADGTRLRLQALATMGHSPTRVARAIGANPAYVREITAGRVPEVPREVRHGVEAAFTAWWDKTPPDAGSDAQRAATAVRHRAERAGWLPGAGLDADQMDEPGYRPRRQREWHEPEGTGTAPELDIEREAG